MMIAFLLNYSYLNLGTPKTAIGGNKSSSGKLTLVFTWRNGLVSAHSDTLTIPLRLKTE